VAWKIYDVLCRKVRTLVVAQKAPGTYQQQWDGRADNEQPVASGIYFYMLRMGDFKEMKKMVLLR